MEIKTEAKRSLRETEVHRGWESKGENRDGGRKGRGGSRNS